MALSGKTVQYTLAVDMQTGQLTAESKKVASELSLIQKQTQITSGGMLEFGKNIKQLKSELSLLFLGSFGGYALAVGILGDALSAAATKANEFINGVKFDPKILEDMNAYSKILKDVALTQDEIVAGKIREYTAQIQLNKLQNENTNNQRSFFFELTRMVSGGGFDIEKLTQAYNEWTKSSEKLKKQTEQLSAEELVAQLWRQAGINLDIKYTKEINQLKEDGLKIDRQAASLREEDLRQMREVYNIESRSFGDSIARRGNINESVFGTEQTLGFNRERTGKENFQFTASNLLVVEAKNAREAAAANRELAMARFEADSSLENAIPLLDLVPSKLETVRMAMQALATGFGEGFAAIGAAVVDGANSFKAFGAVFLQSIANLAVQFGTFLILTGVAANAAPFLGLSGSAAIAAGIALTVFGGALGAAARKLGGSGGSRGEEREQRFRDSRFGTNGGQGGMTIINNINFANTIGLTRDAMKEVGEVVSAEIFKQQRLGIITQPA